MADMNIPIDEEFVGGEKSGEWTEQVSVAGGQLVETIQALLREAVVRKITVVDKDGKTLIDIPLYAGVLGVALLGYWSVLALIAAWFTEVSIRIVREEMPETAEEGEPVVSGATLNDAAGRAGQTVSNAAERAGTGLSDLFARASKAASDLASRAADTLEPKPNGTANGNGNGHATATKAATTKPAAKSTTTATAQAEPARCQATTKSGTPCKNPAREGSAYCGIHQPA